IAHETIEIDTLYSDQPLPIEISIINGSLPSDADIYVNDENIEEINHLEVNRLQKNEYINIVIKYEDLLREYNIQTLPSDFPEIEKIGLSDIEGLYYTNIYANNQVNRNISYIVKMSEYGEILFYKRNDKEHHISDFERWDIDGDIRQTYFEATPVAGFTPIVGY